MNDIILFPTGGSFTDASYTSWLVTLASSYSVREHYSGHVAARHGFHYETGYILFVLIGDGEYFGSNRNLVIIDHI